jgi:ectoine hydroxylase-related dioxygenase (phytanoyl-CoA dioxygenase family)
MQHLEVEGYVLFPDTLDSETVAGLRDQLSSVPTGGTEYTDKKQVHNDIQWAGGALTELIAHPPTIAFLADLFGGTPIMMTYDYSRSEPGCPPINLHCDGQPWGSKIFGPEQSCPKRVRVLYYLQDLTSESVPFRVVPRSHLSFHNNANPYLRYKEHPEQVMVIPKAGDAVLINQNVVHGNYANQGDYARELLGIAYRPTWAGPCDTVKPWPEEELVKVSPAVREVLRDRNTRVWAYDAPSVPPNLASEAPGINPSRWDRT